MLKGFKDFILRGNVTDLAVGIIMGSAFTAIVDALVKSVLMPSISLMVGQPNFDDFLAIPNTSIKIGVFLTATVNFLLVAAAVYFAIMLPVKKLTELANRNKAEEKEETELELLKDIRDSLARRDS